MIKFILLIPIFILNLFATEPQHPVHVSVTNIEYHEQTMQFEVSFRIFKSDFIETIQHIYTKYIPDLSTTEGEEYMCKYIEKMFCFGVNASVSQENIEMIFDRKKFTDQEVWLYYKTTKVEQVKSIEVNNMLFNDTFFDQTNLVIISYKDKQEGFKLDYDNQKASVDFLSN